MDRPVTRNSAFMVRLNTHTADSNAMILVVDGVLIGIVCELQDEAHGTDRGKWAIEAAFGPDERPSPAAFASPGDAADWLAERVGSARFNLSGPLSELR